MRQALAEIKRSVNAHRMLRESARLARRVTRKAAALWFVGKAIVAPITRNTSPLANS
jgi:hypothetical protein